MQILLVVLCIGVAIPAQSQIQFGIKGGVNMSKASLSKKDFKTDNFTGFFLGPVVDITVPIVGIGLDVGLLYSQKGVTFENKEEGVNFSETIKQKGIDIPINLKYNIGFSRLLGIYFAAGPDFFFAFDSDKGFKDYNFKKKKSQIGLNLGAGAKLLGHLHLGFNYNIPLNNSAEIEIAESGKMNKYKTKTWQISLAYMF
ncbi:MAG: PorT family protein [Bacteroidales bacterium]|nr:PorT family protein [Bacteroidales bacterium]